MNREVRLPMPTELGANGRRLSPGAAYALLQSTALDAYQEAVVKLSAIDPVTTEIVRLRCARLHDCHT